MKFLEVDIETIPVDPNEIAFKLRMYVNPESIISIYNDPENSDKFIMKLRELAPFIIEKSTAWEILEGSPKIFKSKL